MNQTVITTHYYTFKGKDYQNMKEVCVNNNITSRAFRSKVREGEIIKTLTNSQNRLNDRPRK